jgi:hypothetical protein
MSALLRYWPTVENTTECLRTEAETVDEALLLAVHEPTDLLRRAAQTGAEVQAGEVELLNELMRPVTDGSAVVIAITGASGVGKSHMVRWLRAQLERHPRRQDLVVVSIPKTASLRRVVELILEPLASAEYELLKQELARATEALTPSTAAELLAAALGEGLREYAERTAEQVQAAPSQNAAMAPSITVARHVRNLVLANEARELWLSKVLLRIVGASLGGASNPTDRQFRTSDLEPPQEAVGQDLPQRVQQALAYLGNANGRYRSTAADVLQEALDGALRTVFRVTEALQQKSIQDVVDDIRRQLLTDGKELVLLIEDLAALSGIQQPLLDIMIAESDEHGRRVRAPIRTAVAVTDGFLAGRQTVLTRAKEQWVIPSEGLSESTIVAKLVELTGCYLNAARWGAERLKRKFLEAASSGTDLYAWVPKFDEALDAEASERLAAFGQSRMGYSLFPFNEQAIRGLAETAMKKGEVWTYNPRAFINEVLRKTLAEFPLFVDHRFPPGGFKSPRLFAEVRTELQRRGYSQEQYRQLEVALFFWAGKPTSLAGAPAIPKAVFDVFSLPWPFGAEGRSAPPLVPGQPSRILAAPTDSQQPSLRSPVDPPTSTASEETIPTAPDISTYETALESWTSTNRLVGGTPNETRKLLARAISQRLELGDMCLEGQKIEPGWFWLPPATTVGNPSKGLIVQVVDPGQDIPPQVVAGLKALARWSQNNESWHYANAETDYAAANALLETLEAKVLGALTDEAEKDAGMVARALHTQSLLLAISTRGQPDSPNLKELVLPGPDESAYGDDRVTPRIAQVLTARSKAIACRSELQDRLKQLIGCFQGAGFKVLAIDADRLKRAWKSELAQRWSLGLKGRERLSEDAVDVLERVSPVGLPSLVNDVQTAVQSLMATTGPAFEIDHARVAWREEMRLLVQEALQLAVWPAGVAERDVRNVIERLSVESIESVIQRLHKMTVLPSNEPELLRLAGLCTVPLPRLSQIACDVITLSSFFNSLNSLIDSQTRSVETEQALEQREALIKSLEWED